MIDDIAPGVRAQAVPSADGRRARAGFWLVAAVYALVMLGGTPPIPLYALWASQMGFGPFTTTLVFAVYALGTALALKSFASPSERAGHRPILDAAVLTAPRAQRCSSWPTMSQPCWRHGSCAAWVPVSSPARRPRRPLRTRVGLRFVHVWDPAPRVEHASRRCCRRRASTGPRWAVRACARQAVGTRISSTMLANRARGPRRRPTHQTSTPHTPRPTPHADGGEP